MPFIQLSDELFQATKNHARDYCYLSVEHYVTSVITGDLGPPENLEELFTPERLAIIDKARAQLDAGLGVTEEQVDEHLAKVRQAWLEQRQQ